MLLRLKELRGIAEARLLVAFDADVVAIGVARRVEWVWIRNRPGIRIMRIHGRHWDILSVAELSRELVRMYARKPRKQAYPDTVGDLASLGQLAHLLLLACKKVDAIEVPPFGIHSNKMRMIAFKDLKRI